MSGGQVAAIFVGAIIIAVILAAFLSVLMNYKISLYSISEQFDRDLLVIYVGCAAFVISICFFFFFSVAVHIIVIKV